MAKLFHGSYKVRDSPEALIDAALGRIVLSGDEPRREGGDAQVRISVSIHGGGGTIRQGIRRQLVVRFELAAGLHVYAAPVPEGMVPATVQVEGPPGLVFEDPVLPPSQPLRLESLGVELRAWSGRVDIAVPFYATGELASEVRPLDRDSATLTVTVRYQACDDQVCLLPRTEKLTLEVPLDVVDVPALSIHAGHGQRTGSFDATPHLRRLRLRKIRQHPVGFLRFLAKTIRLELAARLRRHSRGGPGRVG
ncbi:MAG: protein-disulfide reductase DsbD domain-containing protein [Myxococcota bacterium]